MHTRALSRRPERGGRRGGGRRNRGRKCCGAAEGDGHRGQAHSHCPEADPCHELVHTAISSFRSDHFHSFHSKFRSPSRGSALERQFPGEDDRVGAVLRAACAPELERAVELEAAAGPLALAVPPVTWARPVNVTVTGPLSPLLQPLDLDSTTFRLSLAAAPAMVPVPVKGSHCAEEDEVPLPVIVLAPTRVPFPCL